MVLLAQLDKEKTPAIFLLSCQLNMTLCGQRLDPKYYHALLGTSLSLVTDEGNISPDTMPNTLSLVIAFCGALLVLKPTPHQLQDRRFFILTGIYVGILAAGIYAMSLFGFEYAGPVLALAIMLMIGERRPLWLGAGVILMPFIIWFLVMNVLGRALP